VLKFWLLCLSPLSFCAHADQQSSFKVGIASIVITPDKYNRRHDKVLLEELEQNGFQ